MKTHHLIHVVIAAFLIALAFGNLLQAIAHSDRALILAWASATCGWTAVLILRFERAVGR